MSFYRTGYEAIRNAYRHSGGTELHIDLHYRRRSLQLDIQDNGRGIDVAFLQSGKIGHFWLTSMRERAWGLGGTLNIVDTPDLGSRISRVFQAVPFISTDRGYHTSGSPELSGESGDVSISTAREK